MYRPLMLALLFVLTCTAFACRSYTKALEQSVERADELAAISALRTVTVAQRTYSATNDNRFGTFEQLVQGGYLDSRFSSDKPKFKGYVLTMSVTNGAGASGGSFSANADPEPPQQGRHFYMDSESGIIHVNASQPAGASDPSLEP
jgi:hypothetical protein